VSEFTLLNLAPPGYNIEECELTHLAYNLAPPG